MHFLLLYTRLLSYRILMYYYLRIFSILVGVFLTTSLAGNDPIIWALSGQEAPSQEPVQISNQITQAREDIENEVKKQGEIIGNEIREQFGFEDVQSNLTQAYQDSFSGDLNSTTVTLQSTESALEDSIISLLRSGQQLVSVSQNQSIILEDNTRDILNTFGEALSNLSITANQIQSQLSRPQNQ
jgi:hypothetical protein